MGEGRGEYDARDASRLARREDAMNVSVVTKTSTAKYDSQDGLDHRLLSLNGIQHHAERAGKACWLTGRPAGTAASRD